MGIVEQAQSHLSATSELSRFMCVNQRLALAKLLRGEERVHIAERVCDIAKTVAAMPKTYETDGQGDEALVYLHYFRGSVDAWVTEKDVGSPGVFEQYQAFGRINIGYGPELGYINIAELIENNVELDLYWTVKPLKDCK